MAIVRTDDKHYKAIADTLREYGQGDTKFTPQEMPQGIINNCLGHYSQGRDEGYNSGYNEGLTVGFDNGEKAQYDVLWDAIQDGGNRPDYDRAFSYSKWNSDTFKPKHNISPTSAKELFRMTKVGDDTTKKIDLIKLEEETGFKLDFSNCKDMKYAFADSGCFSTVGEVDLRKCTVGESTLLTFYGGYGGSSKTEVKKIICDENTYFHAETFNYLSNLQEIRFEGTIGTKGTNGMLFSRSTKLSHDSLFGAVATKEQIAAGKNLATIDGETYYGGIITALQDLSGTDITRSIVLGTTNLAKLTDAEKAVATQKGWTLA